MEWLLRNYVWIGYVAGATLFFLLGFAVATIFLAREEYLDSVKR